MKHTMHGCCGIEVVYALNFLANDDEYSEELKQEFEDDIHDARAEGRAILVTIAPEEGEHHYKKIRTVLRRKGFKELATCPTAMGDTYQIHLFGLGFRKSKEKRSDHRKRSVVLHRRTTR